MRDYRAGMPLQTLRQKLSLSPVTRVSENSGFMIQLSCKVKKQACR